MNNVPEQIFVWPFAPNDALPQDDLYLGRATRQNSEEIEYIRADLFPRWRPIAELPDEWLWGNGFIVRNCHSFWTCEDRASLTDAIEFLDFGGKSMPD